MPLRGDEHDPCNYGPISLDKPKKKDGKFRALLRLRANVGDEALKEHLIKSPKNASYISPTIQNEILDICAGVIQQIVVKNANDAGTFILIADETMDVSGNEQMSLCVRFVDSQNNVHEDFLWFSKVSDMTAEGISTLITNQCQSLGLNMDNLVGQGYDGVSTMSGKFSGVQARIKADYPKALFVHCASHRLNLVHLAMSIFQSLIF